MDLLRWHKRYLREYNLGRKLQEDRVVISASWPIARQDGWLDADSEEAASARAGLDTGEKFL